MQLLNAIPLPQKPEPLRGDPPRRQKRDEPAEAISFPSMLEQRSRAENARPASTVTERKAESAGGNETARETTSPVGAREENPQDESVTPVKADSESEKSLPGPAATRPAIMAARLLQGAEWTAVQPVDAEAGPARLELPSDPGAPGLPGQEGQKNPTILIQEGPDPTANAKLAKSPSSPQARAIPASSMLEGATRPTGEPGTDDTPASPALKVANPTQENEARPALEPARSAAPTPSLPVEEAAAENEQGHENERVKIQTATSSAPQGLPSGSSATGVHVEESTSAGPLEPAAEAVQSESQTSDASGEPLHLDEPNDSTEPGALQKAQRSYQQPQAAPAGAEAQLTLGDLDLDSGNPDSFGDRATGKLLQTTGTAERNTQLAASVRRQVSARVVEHLRNEMAGEKLTLRLNPEKLGQVEIRFEALDDRLTITMSAESRPAEQALQEGSRELADSIGDKSARFNLVDVRVDHGRQDQGRQEARQQDGRRERDSQHQDQSQHGGQQEQRRQGAPHQTGAGEWAAFHLGG